MRGGWSTPPPGKRYGTHCTGGMGGGAGPVWTGAENLAPPTRIRSPDRPARSKLLYRLSYPGRHPVSIYICKTSVDIVRRYLQGVAIYCCIQLFWIPGKFGAPSLEEEIRFLAVTCGFCLFTTRAERLDWPGSTAAPYSGGPRFSCCSA